MGAFKNCIGLENIILHCDYLSVGNDAFANSKWWNNQENGVVYLGKIALSYKGDIPEGSSIVIKEGTKYINDNFLLWEYVNSVGNLISLSLPNSIEIIGEKAFYGCSNLKDIKQSENTITIGDLAFDYTAWMSNRPNGLLYIGNVLYRNIGKLKNSNVDINDGTVRINHSVFENDSSLISINIPKSVRYIGNNIFDGCVSLDRITVDANNPYFDSRDNSNAIIDKSNHSLIYGSNKTIIPSNVRRIVEHAFCGRNIEKIEIPNQVKVIESAAFFDCKKLSEIVIGNSIDSIGGSAFRNCFNLKQVISNVMYPFPIRASTFWLNSNTQLNAIYDSVKLYVPKGTKSLYQNTEGWNRFHNIIEFDPLFR